MLELSVDGSLDMRPLLTLDMRPLLTWCLCAAVENEAIAPIFSRNRGFRRRFKRYGTGKAELD